MTPRIGAPRFTERHDVCPTDTQYVVQLSGYAWALKQGGAAGGTILDVAAGTGFGSNLLSERGRLVIGVDLTWAALDEARRRYRRPNLAFLQAEASALPLRARAFDLVVSQDTIEHVADDRRFATEVARILKPGGAFVVFTPWRGAHSAAPENPFHLREYSAASLRTLLAPHFAEIRLWGRRPAAELVRAESEMDRVRRFDPLGLRSIVPRDVRHRLGSLWLRMRGVKPLDRVSVEDVEYVEGAPPGSTTLIAVCRSGA